MVNLNSMYFLRDGRSIGKSSFFSKKSQHCIKEGKEKGFVKHSKNPFVDCKACDKPLGYVKLPRRGMQKFTDAKGQSK